ncbi:MAG: DUF2934 domain-containing protein [Sulfuritalea sp.]|nr:DUF2934 domain-containing protein [Sulfuritalea sp.]
MANTTRTVKSPPSKPAAPKPKQTPAEIKPAKAKPKTEAKAAPAVKPAVKKPAKPRSKKPVLVPPEQRRFYVEVAAYHIAERRGFAAGDPLEDWVQAEAEIDRLLAAGLLGN